MKEIILIYGEDQASEKAYEEIIWFQEVHSDFQELGICEFQIIKDINIIDSEYETDTFPLIILKENNEETRLLGYDIDQNNFYFKIICEKFLTEYIPPFFNWIWNHELKKWEEPIPKPENSDFFYWNQNKTSWVHRNLHPVKDEEKNTLIWLLGLGGKEVEWNPPKPAPDIEYWYYSYYWDGEKEDWVNQDEVK